MRLENKTTLVTGASKGMGESEARLFASQGANVVLCDVDEREGEKTVKSITESGGTAEFMQCDVTNESDWKRVINATTNKFGSLDVLVNNAGLSSGSTEDHLSSEWWHKIMDVNATGVFLGTKIAAEIMKERQSGKMGTLPIMPQKEQLEFSLRRWL